MVAAAGALFASTGVAKANVLYDGIYRNWQSGNCLDINGGSVYTHSCVSGDPNQIWLMYGLDDTHQVWVNEAFGSILWDNGNGSLQMVSVQNPWQETNGLGVWKPGF